MSDIIYKVGDKVKIQSGITWKGFDLSGLVGEVMSVDSYLLVSIPPYGILKLMQYEVLLYEDTITRNAFDFLIYPN